ncbi:MAG: hypothetical protein V4714_09565, partial [Bacteroidota bacterium]
MPTNLPLVTKPGKSSRFCLWVTAVFFIALCSSASAVWAQTGLHFTTAEVAVWRLRASSQATSGTTNYKVANDVPNYSTSPGNSNSPGDWKRITDFAADFNNNPSKHRFTISFSGCIPKNGAFEPTMVSTTTSTPYTEMARGEGMMDAAFVDLVMGTNTSVVNVRNELLWHAKVSSQPSLNFADQTRWCRDGLSVSDYNPGFAITEWMMRLLFAYDCYKNNNNFTTDDRSILDTWFRNAGLYFQNDLDYYYRNAFSPSRTTTLGETALPISQAQINAEKVPAKYPLYYNSNGIPPLDSVGKLGQSYNNRMCTIARFIGAVGVFLKDASLKITAKRFFYEWLRYGVYPSMDIADMSRTQQQLAAGIIEPEKGFDYAMGTAFVMSHLADIFARDGDESLVNYSTTEGYFGSQVTGTGSSKTLKGVIENLQKYLNGTHNRYAPHNGTSQNNGLSAYRINGTVIAPYESPGVITFDTWFALANKYYRDPNITSNYIRSFSGTTGYPATAKKIGSNNPWSGCAAVIPATLFMYGQMENTTASPYSKVLPVITWANPANIIYGTALSSTQLNASASVTGTFTYSPAAEYILNAGANQSLLVNFMPADTFNFKATSDTALITVNQATPVVTWATPASIVY